MTTPGSSKRSQLRFDAPIAVREHLPTLPLAVYPLANDFMVRIVVNWIALIHVLNRQRYRVRVAPIAASGYLPTLPLAIHPLANDLMIWIAAHWIPLIHVLSGHRPT